jgi:RNA polymerase sigma-70 factor (ECF subfamily)
MDATRADTAKLKRGLARDLDRHFDGLVTTYQRPLFAFAYRMSGCPRDAEEVVQDVFVRAYRALKSYETDRILAMAIQPWLYRICLNLSRNRGRKQRVRTVELIGEGPAPRGHADPTADGYEGKEAAREMQSLVLNLPVRYRAAVVLKHVNDLSYAEIAAALDQPEGTVKSNVHRGLEMLRRSLLAAQEELP